MNINLYKKINWFSISFLSFSLFFMIIGLSLLSSKTSIIPEYHINGFGLINYFEDFKGGKYYIIYSFLDIFKNNIKLDNSENTWNVGSLENITNIRCGIVFAIFLTPIFAFISLNGFTYNYINFYKHFKNQ